jgi:hydrocephalus-inducing protein
VERALTAKVGHVEVLKVSNWMHKPQRFRVIIDRKQADK